MTSLGKGIYGLTEAAKLTRLQPRRVRDWFRSIDENGAARPVFESDYRPVGGDQAISFLDLIEVFIAGRLREADPPVSLQHIRKVHRKLARETDQRHPFCTREIYHSGGKIFTRPIEEGSPGSVIEPLTNQTYINAVIMPFLEQVRYDPVTNLADLWKIDDGVVVDPARCFGKPIVDAVGIATRVLAGAYEANGCDALRVADWYEIDPAHVEAAVRFEGRAAA